MANVLQDYFSRMNALNRQRGMTGNMQYGRSLDPSIAEGYFDSYQKTSSNPRLLPTRRGDLIFKRKVLTLIFLIRIGQRGFRKRDWPPRLTTIIECLVSKVKNLPCRMHGIWQESI